MSSRFLLLCIVDFHNETVDGDKGPLPILHISLMQLPTIPDAEDWAPTELMGSDGDSDESISDCGDIDMSDFATELKEIADGMHRLQQPSAATAHTRCPLGAYITPFMRHRVFFHS